MHLRPLSPTSVPTVRTPDPATRTAPAVPETVDVLEVTYPSVAQKCAGAASLAKEGLLTLGLAPLGALLLGPAGALAGWALSSLRKLRQSKTQGLGPRLKQALPALALAGGVAATGALIGPWGAAALALSSVALPAATSWVESSRRDPQVRIDPQAFTRAYVDKVQQALARVQPELSLQVELGTPQLQMQSVLRARQKTNKVFQGDCAL